MIVVHTTGPEPFLVGEAGVQFWDSKTLCLGVRNRTPRLRVQRSCTRLRDTSNTVLQTTSINLNIVNFFIKDFVMLMIQLLNRNVHADFTRISTECRAVCQEKVIIDHTCYLNLQHAILCK